MIELSPGKISNLPGIEFKRVSPHMECGFPGEITVYSYYLLSAQNQLVMKWEATMQDEQGTSTPINLCNHAYWNLSGDFKEANIGDHELFINSSQVLEFNKF